MKITQRPYKFCFSKNPVQYTFDVPEHAQPGCYVLLRIFIQDIGGAHNELLYEEKIKTASTTVIYNVADIVESALEYAMPDFAGATIQAGSNVKEFYIDFTAITDAAPVALWVTDVGNPISCIKGGIPAPLWDWNNYFVSHMPSVKPFLTWQPGNRFVGKDDEFFISFFNTTKGAALALLIDAVYADGSASQLDIPISSGGDIVYHILAGSNHLNLNADPAKKLYKYSLSVVEDADHANVIAAPYTYYIDYRQFYNTKFLHYYNSLGGIECVRIRGEVETTAEVSFTDSERFNGGVAVGAPNSEQYTQTGKNKFDSFKGDAGYLYSSAEQDVFQEVLLTRFAWERIIGKNLRVYSLSKSTKMRSSLDKTWTFGLEWRYAFTNSVYAPLMNLGSGTEDTDSYCQKVAIPGDPQMTDAVVGVPYSFSFTLTGDTPITIGAVTKPSWMNAPSISGKTVTLTGTPDTGGTAAVSIVFTNCSTGSAEFTGSVNVLCVAIDGAIDLPPGYVGEAYSATCHLLGVPPFTINIVSKPSWMSIITSGDTLTISGTPDAVGDDMLVSFQIESCSSLSVSRTVSVVTSCLEYYNNTGTTYVVTYIPCGDDSPVAVGVAPGESICGKSFSGDWGYLTYLGPCS